MTGVSGSWLGIGLGVTGTGLSARWDRKEVERLGGASSEMLWMEGEGTDDGAGKDASEGGLECALERADEGTGEGAGEGTGEIAARWDAKEVERLGGASSDILWMEGEGTGDGARKDT